MNVRMKAPKDMYNERWVIQSEPIKDFDFFLSDSKTPYISVKIFVSVIAPKRRLFYSKIEKRAKPDYIEMRNRWFARCNKAGLFSVCEQDRLDLQSELNQK